VLEARDTVDANAFHKAVLLVTGERLAVSLIYVVVMLSSLYSGATRIL